MEHLAAPPPLQPAYHACFPVAGRYSTFGSLRRRSMSEHLSPTEPAAEDVVAGLLPDPGERGIALRQLVASADQAQSVAPGAWGVTLYRDLFRLNVGRVEVLVVGQGFIRLNCVGDPGTPPLV